MQHASTNTNEVLASRAKDYGSYGKGVKCRAVMLTALNDKHKECNNGEDLPADVIVMFSDVLLKLMRIASNPEHTDSYIDLEGYAKIIKKHKVDDSEIKGVGACADTSYEYKVKDKGIDSVTNNLPESIKDKFRDSL